MRCTTFVLGLASSAVAVALAVLIYGINSQRSSSTAIDSAPGEANETPQTSSLGTAPNKSTEVVQSLATDGSQEQTQANQDQPSAVFFSGDGGIADEDATRERLEMFAINAIRRDYSLLLQDLDLTPREQEALFALLVEDWIAEIPTPFQQGETIDKEEQSRRIAAIIGDHKLQQFRELVSNVMYFAEHVISPGN